MCGSVCESVFSRAMLLPDKNRQMSSLATHRIIMKSLMWIVAEALACGKHAEGREGHELKLALALSQRHSWA